MEAGLLNSLVGDYLASLGSKLAEKFKKETKAAPLPPGSPGLKEIVKHFNTSPQKRKLELTNGNSPAKKSKKEESSSDDDSDEEETKPAKKPAAPAKVEKMEEDSSSDDDSDEEEEKPAAKPAAAPKAAAKKKEESSSEDDSSEDEDEKPAAKPAPTKAAAKKEESSSDDDSDDEEEEKKPQAKAAAKAPAKEESSDDDDSSDDEEDAKPVTKPAAKKEESSDDSDDSSDEDEEKPAAKKAPAKKEESDDDDSSSDDDDEEEASVKKPVKEEEPELKIKNNKNKSFNETPQKSHNQSFGNKSMSEEGRKIFIHNVSEESQYEDFQESVEKFGEVTDFFNPGRGFAFITFSSNEEAQACIAALDNTDVAGRTIQMNIAKPKGDRGGDRGGRGGGRGRGGGGGGGRREEVEGAKLFVHNVSEETSQDELKKAFGKHGNITDAYNPGKGFAFVTYSSPDEAQAAIAAMNGTHVCGRDIECNIAKPRGDRNGGGGGGRGGGGRGGGRGRGGRGGGRGGRGGMSISVGGGGGNKKTTFD